MNDSTPYSPETEEAVLGAMIVDPSKIVEMYQEGLRKADFYDMGRGMIYRALVDLEANSLGPDYITLCDLLKRRGQLEEVGNYSEITRLITACATSVHAVHYANVVKLYALRRRVIAAAGRIAEAAYEGKLEGEELEERAQLLLAAAFAGDDDLLGMTRAATPRPSPKPKPVPAKRGSPTPRLEGVIRDST